MDLYARAEAERVALQERQRLRQMRIVQVREQTRGWVNKSRERYQEEKSRALQQVIDETTEEVQEEIRQQIQDLMEAHDLAVQEIGASHLAAAEANSLLQAAADQKIIKRLQEAKLAKERFKAALKTQREQKAAAEENSKKLQERKEKVKMDANFHSKAIAWSFPRKHERHENRVHNESDRPSSKSSKEKIDQSSTKRLENSASSSKGQQNSRQHQQYTPAISSKTAKSNRTNAGLSVRVQNHQNFPAKSYKRGLTSTVTHPINPPNASERKQKTPEKENLNKFQKVNEKVKAANPHSKAITNVIPLGARKERHENRVPGANRVVPRQKNQSAQTLHDSQLQSNYTTRFPSAIIIEDQAPIVNVRQSSPGSDSDGYRTWSSDQGPNLEESSRPSKSTKGYQPSTNYPENIGVASSSKEKENSRQHQNQASAVPSKAARASFIQTNSFAPKNDNNVETQSSKRVSTSTETYLTSSNTSEREQKTAEKENSKKFQEVKGKVQMGANVRSKELALSSSSPLSERNKRHENRVPHSNGVVPAAQNYHRSRKLHDSHIQSPNAQPPSVTIIEGPVNLPLASATHSSSSSESDSDGYRTWSSDEGPSFLKTTEELDRPLKKFSKQKSNQSSTNHLENREVASSSKEKENSRQHQPHAPTPVIQEYIRRQESLKTAKVKEANSEAGASSRVNNSHSMVTKNSSKRVSTSTEAHTISPNASTESKDRSLKSQKQSEHSTKIKPSSKEKNVSKDLDILPTPTFANTVQTHDRGTPRQTAAESDTLATSKNHLENREVASSSNKKNSRQHQPRAPGIHEFIERKGSSKMAMVNETSSDAGTSVRVQNGQNMATKSSKRVSTSAETHLISPNAIPIQISNDMGTKSQNPSDHSKEKVGPKDDVDILPIPTFANNSAQTSDRGTPRQTTAESDTLATSTTTNDTSNSQHQYAKSYIAKPRLKLATHEYTSDETSPRTETTRKSSRILKHFIKKLLNMRPESLEKLSPISSSSSSGTSVVKVNSSATVSTVDGSSSGSNLGYQSQSSEDHRDELSSIRDTSDVSGSSGSTYKSKTQTITSTENETSLSSTTGTGTDAQVTVNVIDSASPGSSHLSHSLTQVSRHPISSDDDQVDNSGTTNTTDLSSNDTISPHSGGASFTQPARTLTLHEIARENRRIEIQKPPWFNFPESKSRH